MDLSPVSAHINPATEKPEERHLLVFPQRYASSIRYSDIAKPRSPKPVWLLSVGQSEKLVWDALVLLLAIWSCFYVPYVTAFGGNERGLGWTAVEVGIEVVYFVDIGMGFRTSFVDVGTGEEVTNAREIAWQYIRSGSFAIDLVSILPYEFFSRQLGKEDQLKVLNLLKVLKVLRIRAKFAFLRVKAQIKLALRLVLLLFMLAAYLHIQACLWFLLIRTAQAYIPPALYVDHYPDLYEPSDPIRQYAYSLYMSVYMLTAAEIGPRVGAERIFAGLAILSGQLFQGYMFGEIAVVLLNLSKRTAKMAEAQSASATTMANMQLSPVLQGKVTSFMQHSLGLALRQAEFVNFFKLIPPSLQQEVRTALFQDVILLNPIVTGRQRIKISLLHRLNTHYFQPEEIIITQGDKADSLFFVAAGTCKVFQLDNEKQLKQMKSLGIGQHFGEIALLYPTPRTASVIAAKYVTLAILPKLHFCYLLRKHPKLGSFFKATASHYHDNSKIFLKNTLRKCPIFAKLRSSVLSQVIYRLPATRLPPNTYILKEGDICDKVTFVIEGNVQVYFPVNDARLMELSLQSQNQDTKSPHYKYRNRRGTLAHIQKRDNSRFIVRLEVEELTKGSALCPNIAFLGNEQVRFCARTTETTVILTLSKDLLVRICREFPKINTSLERISQQHQSNTSRKLQLLCLDCVRGFPPSVSPAHCNLWRTKMKVKRCALGKVLEKRLIRAKGFSSVAFLSQRLQGIIQAEAESDLEMVEKINSSDFPIVVEHIFPAFRLLTLAETSNPIYAQIAMEAVRVSRLIEAKRLELAKMQSQFAKLGKYQAKISEKLREMQRLIACAFLVVKKQY